METIVFPNAGRAVIDHLETRLAALGQACPVVHTVPKSRPAKFVKVIRTGGIRQTLVTDSAQLTFEAWANSPTVAETLIEYVRAVIHAMKATVVSGVRIAAIEELSGPADLPDPDSQQYRYTFSAFVQTRGNAV